MEALILPQEIISMIIRNCIPKYKLRVNAATLISDYLDLIKIVEGFPHLTNLKLVNKAFYSAVQAMYPFEEQFTGRLEFYSSVMPGYDDKTHEDNQIQDMMLVERTNELLLSPLSRLASRVQLMHATLRSIDCLEKLEWSLLPSLKVLQYAFTSDYDKGRLNGIEDYTVEDVMEGMFDETVDDLVNTSIWDACQKSRDELFDSLRSRGIWLTYEYCHTCPDGDVWLYVPVTKDFVMPVHSRVAGWNSEDRRSDLISMKGVPEWKP